MYWGDTVAVTLMAMAALLGGMPEEILFESEETKSRADIAAVLRTVADRLDTDREISFSSGDQSVTLEPPSRPTFEVKVERETGSGGGNPELSIELELEWKEGADDTDGSLSVE